MAITYIPPRKTWADYLYEGTQPNLQLAMNFMLQRKMAEQERQKRFEQTYQTSPELFAPITPEITQKYGEKIPAKYLKFKSEGMSKTFNPITGETEFKTKEPTMYEQMMAYQMSGGKIPTLATSPEEAKTQFLKDNPQYKAEDLVISSKPMPGGKGVMYYEASVSPETEKALIKAGDVKAEIQAIDNMVDSIYDAADRLIPAAESPQQAEKIGMQRSLGSMSILGMRPQRAFGLSNENVIAYNEIMKAEATPVIRSMGEKGMLTNQDIERALGLFAKNADSIQLRQTRKEELKKFLKSKVKAYYKTETMPETEINADPLGLR